MDTLSGVVLLENETLLTEVSGSLSPLTTTGIASAQGCCNKLKDCCKPQKKAKTKKCCGPISTDAFSSQSAAFLVVTNKRTLLVTSSESTASNTEKKCCSNFRFLGGAKKRTVSYLLGKITNLNMVMNYSSANKNSGACCCFKKRKESKNNQITFNIASEYTSFPNFYADITVEEAQTVLDAIISSH